jgi:hypothetical protein
MALPQKVVDQMGRDTAGTPGWAIGALLFSGGLFFLSLVIYFGIVDGYEPYLQGQIATTQAQISSQNTSISASDQTQLINFYSQISNLEGILKNHVVASQFFTWLEKNTEANVYYQNLSLASGDRVTLGGTAKTEADVSQQMAIFENSPQVSAVTISGVGASTIPGQGLVFTVTLNMAPSVFAAATSTISSQ